MPIPQFQIDDDPAPVPLDEFVAHNEDDEEIADWLERAQVGDQHTFGGGAFAEFTVRRFA